jgi:2-methylcitrate dehydratase PrpD
LQQLPEGRRAEDAATIRVETHWRGLTLNNYAPVTTLAAKFSMPHIVAVAALFGHAGADAFAATTLRDPAVSALRSKVELAPFAPELAWPNDRPARVTFQFPEGVEVKAECLSARGGPDRPFTTEEILEKIAGIAAPVYPGLAAVARRLVQLDATTLKQSWNDLVDQLAAPVR